MPLQRRLPKRGFRNPFRDEFSIVNLRQLEARFSGDEVIDPAMLAAAGLVRRGNKIKILGLGDLTKPLSVKAHAFSESAKTRIAAAGGSAEVVGCA